MIALLIPVLGRAHQIKPLYENIRQTTVNEHRVVFVFSPYDHAIGAVDGLDAQIEVADWQPARSDYAKKLGLGFHATSEPWVFQGATDLVFYPAWDQHALDTARRSHATVIGTNDLGNPLVKRGVHSTHSLIHRDYLDKWGGTVDDTGVIFSEVYDHQWTDNEFVDTARQRRQWAFSRKSIVGHRHPHRGKAEIDETYEKATRETSRDIRLYQQRRAKVTKFVSAEKRRRA